jgi:hypothetical protein
METNAELAGLVFRDELDDDELNVFVGFAGVEDET